MKGIFWGVNLWPHLYFLVTFNLEYPPWGATAVCCVSAWKCNTVVLPELWPLVKNYFGVCATCTNILSLRGLTLHHSYFNSFVLWLNIHCYKFLFTRRNKLSCHVGLILCHRSMQTAGSDEFTFLTDFTQKMNFQQNSSFTYQYKIKLR